MRNVRNGKKTFYVRFTYKEYRAIKRAAKKHGIGIRKYILNTVLQEARKELNHYGDSKDAIPYEALAWNFYHISKYENIEDGIISDTERYISNFVSKKYPDTIINLLSYIAAKYYKDNKVLASVLNCIARIDKEIFTSNPALKSIVILCMRMCINDNRENVWILEMALKVFDSFGRKEDIEFLESFEIKDKWLSDWKEEIIEYIKKKFE